MKPSTLFTFSLLLCSSISDAQPLLTWEANKPLVGVGYMRNRSGYVDPGPAGPDQVWNFDLQDIDLTDQVLYQINANPNFQVANLVLYENSFQELFYTEASDQLSYYGQQDGSVYVQHVVDGVEILAFPCTYLTAWGDDFHAVVEGGGYNAERDGTVTGVADGHGTMIMPYGTVPNVLRVKTFEEWNDYMNNGSIQRHQKSTYRYYTEWLRFPILEVVVDSSRASVPSPWQVQRWSTWCEENDVMLGLSEVGNVTPLIHPTLTADLLWVDPTIGPGTLLRIVDMCGKTVMSHRLQGGTPIDVSRLSPGIYTILADGPEQTRSGGRQLHRPWVRFIKE